MTVVSNSGNVSKISADGKLISAPESQGSNDSVRVSKKSLFTVGAILLLGLVAFLMFSSPAEPVGEVAAVVNGDVVTVEELNAAFAALPQEYQGAVTRDSLLDQLVQAKLVYQKAVEEGTQVSSEDASAELEASRVASGLTDEQFENLFASQGVTKEEMVEEFAKQLTVQRYLDENLIDGIVISEGQVLEYYDANVAQFTTPETVTVRHILFGDEQLSAEEKTAKANEVLASLTQANFCDAVTEHSSDPGSVATCGEYSFGLDDPFVEEFKDLSFSQKPGEMGIAESMFGPHIIWTVEFVEGRVASFEEVKATISEGLKAEGARDGFEAFYEELSAGSDIEIKLV